MRTIRLRITPRLLTGLLALFVAPACESNTRPGQPVPTFTVGGLVKSSADQSPVEGATVEAIGAGADGVVTTSRIVTGAAGTYAFTGLRGQVHLNASRSGFFPAVATIQLTEDRPLDLTLQKAAPTLLEGGDLVLGQTVSGTIRAGDEHCDPNWDSRSPCRRFSFAAPADRVYRFIVRSHECSELELHVILGNSRALYVATNNGTIDQEAVLQPRSYEVRLMAYYTCDLFELTVK